MTDPVKLARPIWSSLTNGWRDYAEGDALAMRLRRDLGVFGAAADRSAVSLAALAKLTPEKGELWTVEAENWPVPPGLRVEREAACVQMIAETPILPDPNLRYEIMELGDTDAPEMLALATMTKPGPYVANTHRLGHFVGVRIDGALAAMAGERMRWPGSAEISAVCTHPDHRGKGLAGWLMREVAARMIARGEAPWLTSYASNSGAIALYERLGFRLAGRVIARVHVRTETV